MKKVTTLFDLDGTLIDSTPAILEGFNYAYEYFGTKKPKQEDITRLIGYPLDIMFAKLGIDESLAMSYVEAYKSHYSKIAKEKTTLLKGAKEAIELASEFSNVGIVTTKTSRYSKILLEHFDVLKYLHVIVGREDVKNPKPDAEPINKAVETLNVDKKNTWMIGDTVLDLMAAKNSNVNSVALLCGYGMKEDLEKYTKNIFPDPLSATKFLQNLYS
ncbi:MAG: HAD family hydrolase [Campylobacteraceae bacterium]